MLNRNYDIKVYLIQNIMFRPNDVSFKLKGVILRIVNSFCIYTRVYVYLPQKYFIEFRGIA